MDANNACQHTLWMGHSLPKEIFSTLQPVYRTIKRELKRNEKGKQTKESI